MNNFEKACIASFNEWETTLPDANNLTTPRYSKKHSGKMKKLFDKMRGNEYHHFTKRTVKTMLIAAIIFALMFCAFMVPSSREYAIEKFSDFSEFRLTAGNKNIVVSFKVGYVPEGYSLIREISGEANYTYTYECKDGKTLVIGKNASDTYHSFNTEGGKTEEFTVDNVKYLFSTNTTENRHLVWTENDYIYYVDGSLSKEEMLKIAQNVN